MLARKDTFELGRQSLPWKAGGLAVVAALFLAFALPLVLDSSERDSCIPLFAPSRAHEIVPTEVGRAALSGQCAEPGVGSARTTAGLARGYPGG